MCNHYQPSKLPNSIAEIGWASKALRNRHWQRCHCYFLGWRIIGKQMASLKIVWTFAIDEKKNRVWIQTPQKKRCLGFPCSLHFPCVSVVFAPTWWVQILPKEARGALGHGPRERSIGSDMPRLSHVRRVGWNAGFPCRCGCDHRWQQLVGGFKYFLIFIPIWGRFPCWLICFRWVETTNQLWVFQPFDIFGPTIAEGTRSLREFPGYVGRWL